MSIKDENIKNGKIAYESDQHNPRKTRKRKLTNLLKRAKIQKTYRISRLRERRYFRHGTDHKRAGI